MAANYSSYTILKLVAVGSLLLQVQVSAGQEGAILLRLQRSTMAAEIDATGGMRGNGGNITSLGVSGGEMATATYPSSASCVAVYNDGRYVFEKREEKKVGNPKVRSTEGTLSGDDLQQLKSILSSDDIKKITGLKPIEPPPRAQLLREAQTIEVQITREDAPQHFLAVKERYKTLALGASESAGVPSTGLDTYLDNASAYRKTMNPLLKWFEGIEKKSKSSLKDSRPQYCVAMTM